MLGRTGVYFKCMIWHYHVHCGRMREDRATVSAPRHEGFSVLCNTKFSRCLFLHFPASKLTASLPLDSWYCSRNVVPVRLTSLAVFFTFQPVYYSTDPYPHNGGTFGIARWQAKVPCSLEIIIAGIITLGPFVRYLWGGGFAFVLGCQNENIIVFAGGRWCNFADSCPRWSRRCVPFEGHRAAHLTLRQLMLYIYIYIYIYIWSSYSWCF